MIWVPSNLHGKDNEVHCEYFSKGKTYLTPHHLNTGFHRISNSKSTTTKANGLILKSLTSSMAAKWRAWCKTLTTYSNNPTRIFCQVDGLSSKASNLIAFVMMTQDKRLLRGWGGLRICTRRQKHSGRICVLWGHGLISWKTPGFRMCRV